MTFEEDYNHIMAFMKRKWPEDTAHDEALVCRYWYEELFGEEQEKFKTKLLDCLVAAEGEVAMLYTVLGAINLIAEPDETFNIDLSRLLCRFVFDSSFNGELLEIVGRVTHGTRWALVRKCYLHSIDEIPDGSLFVYFCILICYDPGMARLTEYPERLRILLKDEGPVQVESLVSLLLARKTSEVKEAIGRWNELRSRLLADR